MKKKKRPIGLSKMESIYCVRSENINKLITVVSQGVDNTQCFITKSLCMKSFILNSNCLSKVVQILEKVTETIEIWDFILFYSHKKFKISSIEHCFLHGLPNSTTVNSHSLLLNFFQGPFRSYAGAYEMCIPSTQIRFRQVPAKQHSVYYETFLKILNYTKCINVKICIIRTSWLILTQYYGGPATCRN